MDYLTVGWTRYESPLQLKEELKCPYEEAYAISLKCARKNASRKASHAVRSAVVLSCLSTRSKSVRCSTATETL
jgi:hypothetical protein